jgi:glucokinase
MPYVGIEIGGTKLQIVVGTSEGTILERVRDAVDVSAGGEGIRRRIASALPGLIERHRPEAVGVGFGGPVDWVEGLICCSHQVSGWHGFGLGDWLRNESKLPVAVDNDANVAALGEFCYGAGRGFNPVFWINMGSGIGGGLVVDGDLYHGLTPGEMEVGHIRLDKAGHTLESKCSGWAVDRRIREAIARFPQSKLAALTGGRVGGEARHLSAALEAKDSLAEELLREIADDLAFGLSHVVHLIHPQLVVLGGGLSLVGEPLRCAIAEALPAHVMDAFKPGPRIALAGLGEDSVTCGALALAARMVGRHPQS